MDAEVKQVVADAIKENLPAVVDAVVSAKFEEFNTKSVSEMEDIKASIKQLSLAGKFDKTAQDMFAKTAVVSIFKDVLQNNVTTEKAFYDVVDATVKTMVEASAGNNDVLVFDQFEAAVLQVINTFDVVAAVKILPLAKGDKLSIPKATNGITTAYVAEGGTPAASDVTSAFVTFNIYKMATLTDFTEELLDDAMTIPDLYELIVQNIGESQGAFLEKQILAGTGSSALEGILVASGTKLAQLGTAGYRAVNIADSDIVTMLTSADRKFKRGNKAKIITSQYVLAQIMKLKTSTGAILYPELRMAVPTLYGVEIILTDDSSIAQSAATDAADKPLMIYGDLSYYTLVRRKGLTAERGYYGNNWRDGIISLKSTARYGGKCTFPEAFTKMLSATT